MFHESYVPAPVPLVRIIFGQVLVLGELPEYWTLSNMECGPNNNYLEVTIIPRLRPLALLYEQMYSFFISFNKP